MVNVNFGFEELVTWKKAHVFSSKVYHLAKQLPKEEDFRLKDQMIRSSRSIGALIAEGHGRFTYRDQIHFLIQARGSLSETVNHLIDGAEIGFLQTHQLNILKKEAKEIQLLINGYILYLRNKNYSNTLNHK